MCLPTGSPIPDLVRKADEPTERLNTPLPPIILDATWLNLPAIDYPQNLNLLRSQIYQSHVSTTLSLSVSLSNSASSRKRHRFSPLSSTSRGPVIVTGLDRVKTTSKPCRCCVVGIEPMEEVKSYASAAVYRKSTSIAEDSDTVSRLSEILRSSGVSEFEFKRVPQDYYDQPLEYRRDVLGAASVDHLCKSIVLVNTQAAADVTDCSDRKNSKYYVVVVQYTARFNNEAVRKYLYGLNEGKIAKKKFNLRLAPEDVSAKLTGYEHNGVTCVGMKTDIPVILDEAITKLDPDYFYLGGGEVDLKLGIKTSEFIKFAEPFIINCSGN